MARRRLPDAATRSATRWAWAVVMGGSTSTASSAPETSVEVIGDHMSGSPEGSLALALGMLSEMIVLYDRAVMAISLRSVLYATASDTF